MSDNKRLRTHRYIDDVIDPEFGFYYKKTLEDLWRTSSLCLIGGASL